MAFAKVASSGVVALEAATRINQRWAMDFVQDALADGRMLRILTIEDTWSREALACVVEYVDKRAFGCVANSADS